MKKVINLLSFSLLLGFLTSCYSPRPVKGPVVAPRLANLGWQRTPGLKLHVFNTGVNQMMAHMAGPGQPFRPVPAFVIEHPTQGFIVFDCGLSPEIAEKGESAVHPLLGFGIRSRSVAGMDLASQMRKDSLVPEQVKTVIISHTHFDHTGSAAAFRKAVFLAGREAREWSHSWLDGVAPEDFAWIPARQWQEIDFPEAKPYATFPQTQDLFGDGSVILIDAGGHTHGDLAALVQLPAGPVLLAGDAVVHFDWLNSDDVQKAAQDKDKAAVFRNQVRALQQADPAVVIVPGHDLSDVPDNRTDIIRHRPEWFGLQRWEVQ